MPRHHPTIERGQVVAHHVLRIAFRIACAVVFLPIALHEMSTPHHGVECFVAIVLGLVLPALLAPHPDDN